MRRVLVVDDEADVKDLFLQRFRREIGRGEVAFAFAHSGEEALGVFARESQDFVLILSDIHMPGMNGFELLRELRTLRSDVDVVMISAYTSADKESLARELGASGFVHKPIDFEQLRPRVLGQTREAT